MNFRSIAIVIALLALSQLVGCMPLSYTVNDYKISMLKPMKAPSPEFKDENITATFFVMDSQISFDLVNNTDKGIKINWDEVAYIDPTGQSMRVIHNGIKLIDRNAPQAPTFIPPMARINDIIIPSENISYVSGQYGGWKESDLFPGKDKSIYTGAEFGIYFPLEIKGEKKEYNLRFKVNKINQEIKQI